MPLDISGVVTGQVIQAAHITQFYNLLTGLMTDQVVTLKNQVTVGGNQGTGVTPLVVQGVSGQTADLFDVKQFGGTIAFGVSAAGAITFSSGVTVSSGGIVVTGASNFVTGGVTVQAGGLWVQAGGLGIGIAPVASTVLIATGYNITMQNAPGGSIFLTGDQVHGLNFDGTNYNFLVSPLSVSSILVSGGVITLQGTTSQLYMTGDQVHGLTYDGTNYNFLVTPLKVVSLIITTPPAFVAGDHYLVIDGSGNVHKSALGPAS